MSANGIAHLASREARQKAKLDLAATKRAADAANRDNPINADLRSTYDITELPTQFSGNTIVDNANAGGLVVGRPWVAISYLAGLYRRQYNSWPAQNTANPTWFDTATQGSAAVAQDFELTLTALQNNRGYQWLGYFKPDYTGTWTFSTNGAIIDDTMTVWIGSAALSGYTTSNSVLNVSVAAGSGTVSLTSGTYYPIRVQYANNSSVGASTLWWSRNGSSLSKTWTNKLYYNSATNGF